MSLSDQIRGGLYGLLVGDALGVPYEFRLPDELPPREHIDMVPPPDFHRAHSGVLPGTWSDDGAQALCLLASLLHCEELDIDDLGNRFVNWWHNGYMAADGRVFDIGNQTSHALMQISSGVPARAAARSDERANGNGSLMRVLPLALWHRGEDAELVADAHESSLPTHGHPRAQVCCALYVLIARRLLEGERDPWEDAAEDLTEIYAALPTHARELEEVVLPYSGMNGSGYVVDCLHSAYEAFQANSFRQVALDAVSFGNDTDTTAAVACGLAGIRFGASAIPESWINLLRDKEQVEPLLRELIDWRV